MYLCDHDMDNFAYCVFYILQGCFDASNEYIKGHIQILLGLGFGFGLSLVSVKVCVLTVDISQAKK